MAKPENTPYKIIAQIGDGPETGINKKNFSGGILRTSLSSLRPDKVPQEEGIAFFGLKDANNAIIGLQKAERRNVVKKERAKYFLRKMTMSDLMLDSNWDTLKKDPRVKAAYKKYLLMDLLRENGYQMS